MGKPIHEPDAPEFRARDLGLVFTIAGGGPVNGDNLRRRDFARLTRLACLPPIRPHDLRHTYASLLLADGEQLKTVSELMGHSSVSTTADIYGHLDLAAKRVAVSRLARILSVASSG